MCLAAYDRGLGTCVIATVIRFPDLLRRLLPGGEGKRFVIAVTLAIPTQKRRPTPSRARVPTLMKS